jgi:hypothetical protein
MIIKTITPIEYLRGGYKTAIVLIQDNYGDLCRIECVRPGKEHYEVQTITGDYGIVRLRPYQHGLIVIESPDYNVLRQRLADIMLALPDEAVIQEFVDNGWELESDENHT